MNYRFVEITYKGEETYKDIDGYLFGTSKETLRSTQENPEDDCYCSKLSKDETGTKSCFLDGIIDMQTCFGKIPYEYISNVNNLNIILKGFLFCSRFHTSYGPMRNMQTVLKEWHQTKTFTRHILLWNRFVNHTTTLLFFKLHFCRTRGLL
jgi:hypothetical protein